MAPDIRFTSIWWNEIVINIYVMSGYNSSPVQLWGNHSLWSWVWALWIWLQGQFGQEEIRFRWINFIFWSDDFSTSSNFWWINRFHQNQIAFSPYVNALTQPPVHLLLKSFSLHIWSLHNSSWTGNYVFRTTGSLAVSRVWILTKGVLFGRNMVSLAGRIAAEFVFFGNPLKYQQSRWPASLVCVFNNDTVD